MLDFVEESSLAASRQAPVSGEHVAPATIEAAIRFSAVLRGIEA